MHFLVLDQIVEMVARVHGHARKIGRFDKDLARQLTRSSSSVGLNAAEGLHGRGGTRTHLLDVAMRSGRESILGLRIAGACGYLVRDVAAGEIDAIDKIVATLFKLSRR